MKQTGQSCTASSVDDSIYHAPMSRFRAGCEGAGFLLMTLSAIAMIALLPAWLEFGAWTEVLTWFAAAEGSVFLIGAALSEFGYRAVRRCPQCKGKK